VKGCGLFIRGKAGRAQAPLHPRGQHQHTHIPSLPSLSLFSVGRPGGGLKSRRGSEEEEEEEERVEGKHQTEETEVQRCQKGKDYQLQECRGICVRPFNNKTTRFLSLKRSHNGDVAG